VMSTGLDARLPVLPPFAHLLTRASRSPIINVRLVNAYEQPNRTTEAQGRAHACLHFSQEPSQYSERSTNRTCTARTCRQMTNRNRSTTVSGMRRIGMSTGVMNASYLSRNPTSGRMTYSGPPLKLAKAVCDSVHGGQVGQQLCGLCGLFA
jgi:hypothetical protein